MLFIRTSWVGTGHISWFGNSLFRTCIVLVLPLLLNRGRTTLLPETQKPIQSVVRCLLVLWALLFLLKVQFRSLLLAM